MENFLEMGILNWFPFQAGKEMLLLGGKQIYKEEFERRGIRVRWVKGISDFKMEDTYDYIVVPNGDELLCKKEGCLSLLKKGLKEKGHLFFACRNRLALRNFVGDRDPYTDRAFDGIENYCSYTEQDIEQFAGRCYAKNEIEQAIKNAGFSDKQYRGYSVFPGLEMPQLFFSWDYLPQEDLETRYTPLYTSAKDIFLRETNICDSLIQNNMLHQMANAYLLDCSISERFYEFNQVTISMERGEECATATILQKDDVVVKKALYPLGNKIIQELKKNTRAIKEKGIQVVELEDVDAGQCDDIKLQGVTMEYVQDPLANIYLRNLMKLDKEQFIQQTEKFLNLVLESGEEIKEERSELGPVYKVVYFDFVPINCFYKDGDFVFFDQEYAIERYPINVVLTRVLDFIYGGNKKAEKIVPIKYFTDKYHLTDKLITYRTMSARYLDELKHSEDLEDFHRTHKTMTDIINRNRQKMSYSIQEYLDLFVNYLDDMQDKKIYLFGSGLWAKKFVAQYGDDLAIDCLLDNNAMRWGHKVEGIPVENPAILCDLDVSTYKVIVCVKQYAAIVKQLKDMGVTDYGIYDPDLDLQQMRGIQNSGKTIVRKAVGTACGEKNSRSKPFHIGYVAGVFDLFHVGHLNLLRRAKEQCDVLLVGVVSDEQASTGKAHAPYVRQQERREIVQACKYVDEAFVLPIAAAGARDVYRKYHFDAMFSGNDYEHDSYWLKEQAWLRERGSDLIFFPYTESTSSTKLKAAIEEN
ncbi:MAG: adenylyltransferase/cytidyltransferase family protein [Lachnospiraceae bacterium]|nr:adenylyltransferase/cytidyltransferase family protein [Lachnospiraceae bacterium]